MDYKDYEHRKLSSTDYLKLAFFMLLEKKEARKITVKELCDEAGVNRSTFYANFENLETFFEEIIKTTAVGLVEAVSNYRKDPQLLLKRGKAKLCYTKWFSYIHQNKDEFLLLLGPHGLPEFREFLDRQGVDWYTNLLKPIMYKFEDKVSIEVLANYIIGAHEGLMYYYLRSGMKFSPEYMAAQLVFLTFEGPISLLNLFND